MAGAIRLRLYHAIGKFNHNFTGLSPLFQAALARMALYATDRLISKWGNVKMSFPHRANWLPLIGAIGIAASCGDANAAPPSSGLRANQAAGIYTYDSSILLDMFASVNVPPSKPGAELYWSIYNFDSGKISSGYCVISPSSFLYAKGTNPSAVLSTKTSSISTSDCSIKDGADVTPEISWRADGRSTYEQKGYSFVCTQRFPDGTILTTRDNGSYFNYSAIATFTVSGADFGHIATTTRNAGLGSGRDAYREYTKSRGGT